MSRFMTIVLVLCTSIFNGCQMTIVLEPLPVSTPVPSPDTSGTIQAPEPTSETAEKADNQDLTPASIPSDEGTVESLVIEQWEHASYYALEENALGNNWVALARPLSAPYAEAEIITQSISSGWIAITPDKKWEAVTGVDIQDSEGRARMQMELSDVIVTPGAGFEDLNQSRSNWYDPSTHSVLWVAHVFVPDADALYSVVPSQASSLAVAPNRLECQQPVSPDGTAECILTNRFFPNLSATYTGTYTNATTSAILPKIDFYATVIKNNPSAKYGLCNDDELLCILKTWAGEPDLNALHDRVCREILRCSEAPSQWCVIWVC